MGGIAGLGVAAIILVAFGAAVASVFHIHAGEENLSIPDAAWEILQRAIDPGQLDGELKWESRILLLCITALGILLISTLISIVNSTLERRIERLRRGRGPVEAKGHIVILGWNGLGPKVAEELVEAYADVEAFEVVVLAQHDPFEVVREVQEDLRRRNPSAKSSPMVKRPETWLTARRGDLRSVADLSRLAQLGDAKSVIILGDKRSDAETAMIIMAIVAAIQTSEVERKEPLNMVAMFDDDEVGRRLRKRIHLLSVESRLSGEPIGEVIPVGPALVRTGIESQVARHRGLSEVYRDLLDFDGDEFYVVSAPDRFETFGEVVDSPGVVPLGTMDDDGIDLWPGWDMPLEGKSLIVLAPSSETAKRALTTGGQTKFQGLRPFGQPPRTQAESILVIGWNSAAERLVSSLQATSSPGSSITVLAHDADHFSLSNPEKFLGLRLMRRTRDVDPLDERSFIEQYDHVIVLAHEELSPSESDAAVLSDVLACRIHVEGSEKRRDQPTTVVAELREPVSKNIAGVRLADDLLLSDSLGASAMVQLAVNPHLLPVLSAILESDSPNHVQLMSIEERSSLLVGLPWSEVRRSLLTETGELAVAVRQAGINARVLVNPPADYRIAANEEVIVFGRYA